MCGIVGIINKVKTKISNDDLTSALQTIAHRGPDASGTYYYQNVSLGNVRLAILDLDPRSNMPLHFEHLTITYNGEVYNYPELREELVNAGYTFDTFSDTEVVLKAYHAWGKECLTKFNGMWAFAILDKNRNEIFCSRDRFGIKPFYYSDLGDTFCFASEIKALTKMNGWQAKANPNTAYNYLLHGMQDYHHETLFKDVYHLPASHYMVYNLDTNRPTIKPYYRLRKQALDIEFEEAEDRFTSLFESSIQLRFRSDVPVGSCLSGGLDSSSIVAYSAASVSTKNFSTVSAVYPGTQIDESAYIQDLVTHSNIKNHSFSPPLDNIFSTIHELLWTQDEPFSSASIFAQNRVFSEAHNIGLRVMLDGQGGDEILAGYDVFYFSHIKNLFANHPAKAVMELIHFSKSYQDSYTKAIQTYRKSKQKGTSGKHAWLKVRTPSDKPPITDRSDLFSTSKSLLFSMGIQALLHYEDRNSMAHSVESRLPFLDYRLVELCLNLPSHFKINKGRRKYILRESMRPYLPHSIYYRLDKKGFETPQDQWIKTNRKKILDRIEVLSKRYPVVDASLLSDDDKVLWRAWLYLEWCEVFDIRI